MALQKGPGRGPTFLISDYTLYKSTLRKVMKKNLMTNNNYNKYLSQN